MVFNFDQLIASLPTGTTFVEYIIKMLVMFGIGGILIYLAIKKDYEPTLLLPIGFGAILTNIPLTSVVANPSNGDPGIFGVLYDATIANELLPVLIFIAVGAMIDFGPLFQTPSMIFFGAAAQFGIFATMMFALLLGQLLPEPFTLQEAGAIGVIGAADGPTTIFVGSAFGLDRKSVV